MRKLSENTIKAQEHITAQMEKGHTVFNIIAYCKIVMHNILCDIKEYKCDRNGASFLRCGVSPQDNSDAYIQLSAFAENADKLINIRKEQLAFQKAIIREAKKLVQL